MQTMTKKQATHQLRNTGNDFVSDFIPNFKNLNVMSLRSKEPGVCWKASERIAFAIITEFSGPNTIETEAPILFRLSTNLYPPPALFYHLKSAKVQHKLGISANAVLHDYPQLQVTGTPGEIAKLGKWLTLWLNNHFFRLPKAPQPPFQLNSLTVSKEFKEISTNLMDFGPEWLDKLYLWTPEANKLWKIYLRIPTLNSAEFNLPEEITNGTELHSCR